MTIGKPDRYVSFQGIDGDGNARKIIAMLRRYIDDPGHVNLLWERLKEKLARGEQDELLLVHSYMNNIRDLFEAQQDEEALALLQQVEEESC